MGYTILKVFDAQGVIPGGGAVPVKRVTFMVGDHGPFSEDFRPGEFTDAQIKQRLQGVANTLASVCS